MRNIFQWLLLTLAAGSLGRGWAGASPRPLHDLNSLSGAGSRSRSGARKLINIAGFDPVTGIINPAVDLLNTIPQAAGVAYNNDEDKYLGAAGTGALLYGSYNQYARQRDFGKIAGALTDHFKARQLFIKGIMTQKSGFDDVNDQLKLQMASWGSSLRGLANKVQECHMQYMMYLQATQ